MVIHRTSSIGKGLYRAYRKLRYLSRRGTLFQQKKQPSAVQQLYPENTFTAIFVNSTFYSLLAYLIVSFLAQLVSSVSALAFDIHTILYYYGTDYIIAAHKWSTDAVVAVFITGPLTAFFLGIILFFLNLKIQDETGSLRLLIIWMIIHCIILSIGDLLMGALFNKGSGYVIMYLFFQDTGRMLIAFTAITLLILLGFGLTRVFLLSGNIYFRELVEGNRIKFIINQFIIPYLVGSLILILVKIPGITAYEVAKIASGILLLLPFLVRGYHYQDLYFDEEEKPLFFSLPAAAVALTGLVLFRIFFGMGVMI